MALRHRQLSRPVKFRYLRPRAAAVKVFPRSPPPHPKLRRVPQRMLHLSCRHANPPAVEWVSLERSDGAALTALRLCARRFNGKSFELAVMDAAVGIERFGYSRRQGKRHWRNAAHTPPRAGAKSPSDIDAKSECAARPRVESSTRDSSNSRYVPLPSETRVLLLIYLHHASRLHHRRAFLPVCESRRFLAIRVNPGELLTIFVEDRRLPMKMFSALVASEFRLSSPFSGLQGILRLNERDYLSLRPRGASIPCSNKAIANISLDSKRRKKN